MCCFLKEIHLVNHSEEVAHFELFLVKSDPGAYKIAIILIFLLLLANVFP